MSSPPEQTPILYRRSSVFILIFFVSGALTIPIVWRSPAFSRGEKTFWSIVAVAYTTLMFLVIVAAVIFMWRRIAELNAIY